MNDPNTLDTHDVPTLESDQHQLETVIQSERGLILENQLEQLYRDNIRNLVLDSIRDLPGFKYY